MPHKTESPAVLGGAFAGSSKRALGHSPNTATPPIGQRRRTSIGDGGGTLFEQEHGRLLWRLEDTQWNGQRRLQVWPWYHPTDGSDPRPCSARFGGGFAVPLDRVPELIAALSSIAPDES